MDTTRELTREDIENAFRRATQSFAGSRTRWAEKAQMIFCNVKPQ